MRSVTQYGRAAVALAILLSGLALLAQMPLLAGTVSWQRFADAYKDMVVVTRAEWRANDNELRVRATTSAGANAVLSVYETSTGRKIGDLSHQGGNEHRGELSWARNPVVITVRSSQGGEATVLVTGDSPPTVTSAAPTATAVTPPAPSPTGAASPTPTPTDVAPSTATPTEVAPTATRVGPTATSVPSTPTRTQPTATGTAWPARVFLPRNLDE